MFSSLLGSGYLSHPANAWLTTALQHGTLSPVTYQRALLRTVYRLLFLFVVEDRGALLEPGAAPEAVDRYHNYYSSARLRRLSRTHVGGPHPDLWHGVRLVLGGLGDAGVPQLGLPALGGLFDPARDEPTVDGQLGRDLLLGAELANHHLLAAIRHLAWIAPREGGRLQPVDYQHLGAEELGSVYESLLELHPRVDLPTATFSTARLAGNERKTTGSYYTPASLVSALLDSALDPVIDDAVKNADDQAHAERRLLALTICDPACGSGGFLVAAARRIARRLAGIRAGDDEPTVDQVRRAMHEVVGRCVYGVDINDMAAELAKVSLWLEAMEPGRPLGFLDARIRVGNALLGTTPTLLADGVPDTAFKDIEGDDKVYARTVRAQNKAEHNHGTLFGLGDTPTAGQLAYRRNELLDQDADAVTDVREQAAAWAEYTVSPEYRRPKLHADAWTSAFVWKLDQNGVSPPTNEVVQQLGSGLVGSDLSAIRDEVDRLTAEYRFFHWHLEFPEVFSEPGGDDAGPEGWPGGFSCMLGNPPWERVKLQEQEFFAARDPEVARAPNAAARRRLITQLAVGDPALHREFLAARRRAEGESALLRTSGRYPLNGRGDVNTYAVFAELFRSLTGPYGRSGVIVPTGIATDATTQYFFKDLVTTGTLAALYDFENHDDSGKKIFEAVDSRQKFCLLTTAGRNTREDAASFAFFLHDAAAIGVSSFALTPEEITLLNPNTGTVPIFRTRRDAEITLGIYRRVPVLINDNDPINGNPWGVSFLRMFDMSNDSHLFHTREQLEADGWVLDGNIFYREAPPPIPRARPSGSG